MSAPRKIGPDLGRYKKEYDQVFCDQLIKHMAQGYSFESFGAIIDIGRSTLYNWLDDNEEFKRAKETGHEKAKYLFETIALNKMKGKQIFTFNGEQIDPKLCDNSLLIFFHKTRFRETYQERVEHTVDEDTGKLLRLGYSMDDIVRSKKKSSEKKASE